MKKTIYFAHRVSYEHYFGEIPGGLQIDHLCRDRLCVRPDHLEAVEGRENSARGKLARLYCCRGHRMDDPANIYIRPDGKGDQCRACIRIRTSRT